MRLLLGQDAIVSRWAGERLGGVLVPPFSALGIIDKRGVLRGAFIIRAHNATTCELSLLSERALTHGVMRGMFRIMFQRLGFARCVINTPRDNLSIRRAAPKMGFKFECKAANFYGPNQPALQFSMTPATCRWLKTHELLLQQAEGARAA